MRLACVLAACGLGFVACQGGGEPDPSQPEPARGGRILAIEGGRLVELDSRTLRLVPGRSAPLDGRTGAAGISPNGARVAVGGRRSVRIVDLLRMKVVVDLSKPGGYASLVSWPQPGRLLVMNQVEGRQEVEALVLDPASGRLLVRRRLAARESWPFGAQRAGPAAVFLLHPVKGVGPVRLVRFDADGRLRVVRLHRIASGKRWTELQPGLDVVRDMWPALAVDEEGGRAFLVGGENFVAEVDLRTFRVEYHSLQRSVSLLKRLRNWFEPPAEAKASDWIQVGALWVGGGVIAVFGVRSVPFVEGGTLQERDEALGFRLVDTKDWSIRMIDEDVRWVHRSGDLLLAYASLWDSAPQERRGIGLRAYALDGRKLSHVLDARPIGGVQVVGNRAFALLDDAGTAAVVDVRTGKVLREIPVDEESTGIPDAVLRPD
jgi:hypothetical protein